MSVSLYGSGQTILQVINTTTTTNISTTSGSFVTTNLSATITPFSTSSKILVLVRYNGFDTTCAGSEHTVFRGGTNLGSATYGFQVAYSTTAQQLSFPVVMNYLDSPATTSATTYTCYMASNGGQTVSAMGYSTPGTITLLEISGV